MYYPENVLDFIIMHSWIKNFNNKRHLCKTISLIKISAKAYTCFIIYCIPHSENT